MRSALPPAALAFSLMALAACADRPSGPAAALLREAPALRTEPTSDASPLGLYLAAETALDAGESESAARLFARASAAAPENASVRERAFTANLLAGRVSEAAALAPLPGESATGAVGLGRLVRGVEALAEGRGKEAAALLSDPAIPAPNAAAAALLLPWAALVAGDTHAASPAPPPAADKLAASFAALGRARLLERAGRFAEAEPVFKDLAVEGQSLFVGAYGGFLERRGRRPEAIALYDKTLKAGGEGELQVARTRAAAGGPAPAQPTVREAAAEALTGPAASAAGARQIETGLIYVRLALRLDPELAQAWLVVGDTLAAAGDAEGARAAYAQVKETSPLAPAAWTRLAVSAQGSGDKAGALALADRAAKRAPEDAQVQVIRAELLRDAGRFDEALAVLGVLIARDGEGPGGARLYFMRGAALERAGRWPAAEADLKRALAKKPDDPEILNYLGFAWADRGEHLHEALAMLEKAAAARPEQGAVLDSVGWARFRLGDARGAVRDLERAVGLEPADPEINDHLGDVYAHLGRGVEARYQWRRVLTLEPEAPMRAAVEKKLGPAPAPIPVAKAPPASGPGA